MLQGFKDWILPPSLPLAEILAARGLVVPDYQRDIYDPFLMSGMKRAVERVEKAIENKEKIVIFGDYDADGVPGSAILASFFEKIGYTNFSVYIPDRHEEAYGLSKKVIDDFTKNGVKLIITVDCGISNQAEVAHALEQGIETIVTDHHLPPSSLPKAVAILNPKQVGDEYPYKELCGAGVAWKLARALGQANGLDDSWSKWLLDLVAIATVADMVPLTGENRALVYFGLKILRRTPRLGLRHLVQRSGLLLSELTEDDIAFTIGPRLNSASRMSHANAALRLLLTTDPREAESIVDHLEEKNQERRGAVDLILQNFEPALSPVLVAGDASWSLGVLGLVASRLVERHNRPVFLWGKNGQGEIKGSCRSDGSVNVVELMTMIDSGKDFFANYGGHAMAGGFSLAAGRELELAERLISVYPALASTVAATALVCEAEVSLPNLSDETYNLIDQLRPFGIGNEKPIIFFPAVTLERWQSFGQTSNHLSLFLRQAGPSGDRRIKAIKFFSRPEHLGLDQLESGAKIDVAAQLETSFFRGVRERRLRIVDVRPSLL